jgi:hypothetical protein
MTTLIDGDRAAMSLAHALERVGDHVAYLRADVNPAGPVAAGGTVPADGHWMSCRALIEDPAWLGRVITATGPGLGTDDPVVTASLFVLAYAYRVLTLTVACLTTTGVVPDAGASRMAVAVSGSRPSLVAYLDPAVLVLGPGAGGERSPVDARAMVVDADTATAAVRFVIDGAVHAHLAPLVAAVRDGMGVRVGERLLWGNVAASAAVAFRTMAGCLGPWVEPVGERFFALSPAPMHGLGAFVVVEDGGRRGWFWERTNCCLFDRLPGMIRCADCGRTPAAERRAAYRSSLSPPPVGNRVGDG